MNRNELALKGAGSVFCLAAASTKETSNRRDNRLRFSGINGLCYTSRRRVTKDGHV